MTKKILRIVDSKVKIGKKIYPIETAPFDIGDKICFEKSSAEAYYTVVALHKNGRIHQYGLMRSNMIGATFDDINVLVCHYNSSY